MRLALALLVPLVLTPSPGRADESPSTDAVPRGSAQPHEASVDDLRKFSQAVYGAKWDPTQAARVDGLVITKDAATFTLTGWIFMRQPVRGIRARAMFFGDGRFHMLPPTQLEKDQLRRFIGKEVADQPVKSVRFLFNGADDQAIFDKLTFSADEATKAAAANDDAKKWIEDVKEYQSKPESAEAAQQRRFDESGLALLMYDRWLNPALEGFFTADMEAKVAEADEKKVPHVSDYEFDFDPRRIEEVRFVVTVFHDKGKASSLACSFNKQDQYANMIDWAGTSPYIEQEPENFLDVAVHRIDMELDLDPGKRVDTKSHATVDLEIRNPALEGLEFDVNYYTKVTGVAIDGKSVPFFQADIPNYPELHAPNVLTVMPTRVAKGQHVQVVIDSESKNFAHVDAATWMVKDEDIWYPEFSRQRGDTAPIFDTIIRAPKGWIALSNGTPQDCTDSEKRPDADCFHYVTNVGLDFTTVNLGDNFRADRGMSLPVDADKDGKIDKPIPITVWTNSTAAREFPVVDQATGTLVAWRSYNLSENGPDAVGRCQIALKVYSEWFGPCPYETLTITPHPKGHGRGSGSLLLIWQDAFLSSTAMAELASLNHATFEPWDMTQFLVHEVAHQWWGGAARIKDDASQWFSEGFADYGSALVLEEYDRDPKANTHWFREFLQKEREFLLKDDGYANTVAPMALGNRFASYENADGYTDPLYGRQSYMYGKGCVVLHSLRMVARAIKHDPLQGDELFKTAMRTFISECRGEKAPSTLDLMHSMESSYGTKLDWFFKEWVFGLGIPKVTYSYAITPAPGGGSHVALHLQQTQKEQPFIFPLAVSVYQGKKELGFDYQWVTKPDQEIAFDLPADAGAPDKVSRNEDLGVLGIFKEAPKSAAGK